MNNDLLSILNINPGKNIALIGFFSNYPVEEYYILGDSAIIFGKSDHLWAHIASASETELEFLLKRYHKKTKYYFSVEDWMIPMILNYGTSEWIMATNRFVLPEEHIPNKPKMEIIEIDKSYAKYMFENSDYKDFISVEYIEDRLYKDISAGVFINNKLIAWGFTHDDGALGFLHVIEEHRKKGYASEIMSGLIQMRKKESKAVFGNIVPDNEKSTNLVTKLGFKFDCKTSWVKLK